MSKFLSGGAITHFQVLSGESRKLFRNAVIMSGCAENKWALTNDDHVKRAFSIAEELGQPLTKHDELVAFLKTVPAEQLVPFAGMDLANHVVSKLPVAPIVESMCDSMNFHLKEIVAIFIGVSFDFRSGCNTAIPARNTTENI